MSDIQERFGLFAQSLENDDFFDPVDPDDLEEFWGESLEKFESHQDHFAVARDMAHSYAKHYKQSVILVSAEKCERLKHGLDRWTNVDLSHQERSAWDIYQKGVSLVEDEYGDFWPLLEFVSLCDRKRDVILEALRCYKQYDWDEPMMDSKEIDALCKEISRGLYVRR